MSINSELQHVQVCVAQYILVYTNVLFSIINGENLINEAGGDDAQTELGTAAQHGAAVGKWTKITSIY